VSEPDYPVEILDGVPVEFQPDAAYDLRTGERWVAYRFVEVPVDFIIVAP